MTDEIHGHAVIDLMLASGRTFSRGSLVDYIQNHFGPAARFHTCSAAGLTAEGLVDLLAAKGKFIGSADAFSVNRQRICQH